MVRDSDLALLEKPELLAELMRERQESKELSEWIYRLETNGPHSELAKHIQQCITSLRQIRLPDHANDRVAVLLVIATLKTVHEALSQHKGD